MRFSSWLAAILSAILKRSSSLNCLCLSASICDSNCSLFLLASAIIAIFWSSTNSLACAILSVRADVNCDHDLFWIALITPLNAKIRVCRATAKPSVTPWLDFSTSLKSWKPSITRPIPAALIDRPRPLKPLDSKSIPFFASLALSPTSSTESAISSMLSAVLFACFWEAFNASMSSSNFFSRPERSAPMIMFFSIAICLMLL